MSETQAKPAGIAHPKGACYMAYTYNKSGFEHEVSRLKTTGQCLDWIGKLNELNAETELIETVIERLEELR